MKYIFKIFLIICLCQNSFSQNIKIDTSNLKYFFWANNGIMDARSGKNLNFDFKYHIMYKTVRPVYYLKESKIIFYDYTYLKVYDSFGKLIKTAYDKPSDIFLTQGDLKSFIFLENRDFYKINFDVSNFTFKNKSKLTELGIFFPVNSLRNYLAFNNNLIFSEGKSYQLKSFSKEITELNDHFLTPLVTDLHKSRGFLDYNYGIISPNHRYLLYKMPKQDSKVLDMQNISIKTLSQNGEDILFSAWVNDSVGYCLAAIDPERNTAWNGHLNYTNIYKVNFRTGEKINVAKVNSDFNHGKFLYDSQNLILGKSLNVSRKGNKLMIPNPNPSYNLGMESKKAYYHIYNVSNYSLIDAIVDIKLELFFTGNIETLFLWTTDNHLLFSRKENISVQGTYLFDTETGLKTKLTSYLLENAIILEDADLIVFKANGELYKCNLNGSNLVKFDLNYKVQSGIDYFSPIVKYN